MGHCVAADVSALTVGDPIEIVGDHDTLGSMRFTISTERAKTPALYPTTDSTVGHPDDLVFRYESRGEVEPLLVRLKTRTGAAYEVESSGELNAPVRAIFAGMHNVATDVQRLSKLRVEKADATVLKAIQMVDESVRSIDIVLLDDRAVILADVGLTEILADVGLTEILADVGLTDMVPL